MRLTERGVGCAVRLRGSRAAESCTSGRAGQDMELKDMLTAEEAAAGVENMELMVCLVVLRGAPPARATATKSDLEGVPTKVVRLLCGAEHEPPTHAAVFLCGDCIGKMLPLVPEERLREALLLPIGESVVYHRSHEA